MKATLRWLPALSYALHASAQLSVPQTLPKPWVYQGCWSDVGRTINQASLVADDMTIEKCIKFCGDQDYPYAGVEYHTECYCGVQLATAAEQVTPESLCNTPCGGDATQPCGGSDRLTLFHDPTSVGPQPNTGIKDWPHLGCYTEGTGGRALPFGAGVPAASMSGASCTAACRAAGYALAGTEYSGECYCGNTIMNGAKPAASGCDMRCNGNSTEICGGSDRLNIYDYLGKYASGGGATTSTKSGFVTSTRTSSKPPGGGPTAPPEDGYPAGWTYQGCWRDGPGPRIMPTYQAPDDPALTRQKCANLCYDRGYNVSGTEYFSQCFCSNAIFNGGERAPDESGCQTACSGDGNQMCGGSGYLSIYSRGTPPVFKVPEPQTTGLNNTWEYKGCYISNVNNARTLPWQIILPDTNSPSECLGRCGQFGYAAGGMEYGQECYCGDPADIINAGAEKRPESECSMSCSGKPDVLCGAGSRQNLYFWNGTTPLYSFKYPQGPSAGSYTDLVPGLVTPLMTMQSITGKVTFLEKYGTGLPNSTGAYELDLSLVNDFGRTWREMHVQSDIFCSAGVILPDKAGRQLTVGGWSLSSTYGVRLYTPDGSPGVNGTNDWEENVNVLSLQQGRWYPSAMVMANGSVLVVGGEAGSNDRPVPTLELLPATGTAPLYMDWLERTDPNNLYPFLSILPSGGIFVQYWNEARILDEVTFETIKILPNPPGGVTDPKAGRTYPLEGTAVLLPQSAPYSEPLGILICGGATTASDALDNCVSIQPDAPNPRWTLERMPSKRVMTCMAPLPDGTYLILNGAKQGVAGFGLASNPNKNAVLYDPSLPLGSRMSVMANTTVARLYHSEAITLLDGRVLVTGSDPQDKVNPQEVRVEVFTPPYLLTGGARPSFTVPASSKDWTYGQSYTINIGQTTGGSPKISLLGAVSSTHGNSMGARTLLPAFSCSGNTCTITAPPNAYVCPPGWYQLFYLENGIPAVGTYVRIGGDPGGLGNWPPGNDFTRPGI